MEFPEPTIDVAAEAALLFAGATKPFGERAEASARLRALFAQAWEEGRWSPPGATLNPYGEPLARPPATGAEGFPGLRLLALRAAAQAALVWVENMAPQRPVLVIGATTVSRATLAEQLRSALGGK